MRSTVDLPPAVRRRVEALAASRGQSVSATIAELTIRGLAQLDEPPVITIVEVSGFPVVSIGRPITSEQVAVMLDDE